MTVSVLEPLEIIVQRRVLHKVKTMDILFTTQWFNILSSVRSFFRSPKLRPQILPAHSNNHLWWIIEETSSSYCNFIIISHQGLIKFYWIELHFSTYVQWLLRSDKQTTSKLLQVIFRTWRRTQKVADIAIWVTGSRTEKKQRRGGAD